MKVEDFADYAVIALYVLAGMAIGAAIVGALSPRRQLKRVEERFNLMESVVLEALAYHAEPLAPPEAYEPGTFTPGERSEEQPRPVYMDVPYRPLPPEDPSRPYIRLSYGDDDAPMGRL